MIRIHDEASIYTAAAADIKHALKYVTRKGVRSSLIMSDSRSVLESIRNIKHPTKTHPIILDIHNELNKLRKAEVNIKFHRVKGYVRIQPNIVADHLAKESIHSSVISDTVLPAVDLITVMKHGLLKQE
ncbi:hypothetical protein Trydic_g3902 [Trypoxylus dichotomus]